MKFYIKYAVCCSDINNTVSKRKEPYSCQNCEKEFLPEEFSTLPSLNGFLLCERCYKLKNKVAFQKNPYAGGYIVKLIDTRGINGYAFSHSGRSIIRAVAYNEEKGFFIVKQEMCDIGEGYEIIELPTNFDYNDSEKIKQIENQNYSDMIIGLFHPILLYVQLVSFVDDGELVRKLNLTDCKFRQSN